MDWQNQHSKNYYSTQINLYVQSNSHQNLNDIHHRDWKIYLKFIWKHKRPWIFKAILNKKSNTSGITIPIFKVYHSSIAIKQHGTCTKKDMKTRIEDLDVNPHIYAHHIFDKDTKNIWWRIDSLFKKCCGENWLSTYRKLKLDPCLSPCTSINSKWTKEP
jgi:hypothetical protein